MPLYFRWSQRPYLLPLYPSLTMMPVLLLQRPSFCSWNMARVFLLQVLCTCCQQWLYWLVLSLIGLLTPVSSPSKLLPWPFQSKQLTPVIALPWFISSVVLIVSWYYLVCVINSLLAASSARMWTESSDFAFVTSGSPLPRIGILKRVSGSPKENMPVAYVWGPLITVLLFWQRCQGALFFSEIGESLPSRSFLEI
jgi:hypothetical protein